MPAPVHLAGTKEGGVDPKRIWVIGGSRGTEAAFLLGVHYPTLVHGVVALSPTDVVNGSLPPGGYAWTFEGKPVPLAWIPAARIRGPIFLACGGADMVWASCPASEQIMSELAARHFDYPTELASYPKAGHFIDTAFPYEPGVAGTRDYQVDGNLMTSNPVALANLWPKLLAFLASRQR